MVTNILIIIKIIRVIILVYVKTADPYNIFNPPNDLDIIYKLG